MKKNKKYKNKIMVYAPTAHNSIVYAPQLCWGRRQ
jgi:hypothetical protein